MGQITIVYWRDIPSQVIAKAGRAQEKRMLPDRFQEAIDMAAMRGGAQGTRCLSGRLAPAGSGRCGDDLATEAESVARETRARI